jgi:uncharacterized protein (TIGR02246 family)
MIPAHPLEAALRAVEAAWNRAARDWDPAALATLYTNDAVLFGGRPEHSVGAASIRAYFESYRGIIASARLELREQSLMSLSPEAVFAQGFGRFSFALAGDRSTSSDLRTSLLLVRLGGWRIRGHHFSPPPTVLPFGE